MSSNLTDRSGTRLFAGERVFQVGGIRVGVFGVSAPPTAGDAARWQAAGIRAAPPEATARAAIAALRQQGAKVVVGLFHVGTARREPPAGRRAAGPGLGGPGAQRAEPREPRKGRRRAPAGGPRRGEKPGPAGPPRRRRQPGIRGRRRAPRAGGHPGRPPAATGRLRPVAGGDGPGRAGGLLPAAPGPAAGGHRPRKRGVWPGCPGRSRAAGSRTASSRWTRRSRTTPGFRGWCSGSGLIYSRADAKAELPGRDGNRAADRAGAGADTGRRRGDSRQLRGARARRRAARPTWRRCWPPSSNRAAARCASWIARAVARRRRSCASGCRSRRSC